MKKLWEAVKSVLVVAALFLGILLPGILAIGNIVVSFGTVRTFIVVVVQALGLPLIHAVSFPISILIWAALEGQKHREKRADIWKAGRSVAWHLLVYGLTGGNLNVQCNKDLYALVKLHKNKDPEVNYGRLALERPVGTEILAYVLSCICLGVMLVIQLCVRG